MNRIKSLYLELIKIISPVRHARLIGVNLGSNCLIYRSMEWPSEPYLVTIGNNVQLTRGVAIHTHGGGNVIRRKVPDFDAFGKVVIKDWAYIGSHAQIMPGVTIGEGAMVAANSVVTKSFPEGNALLVGKPAFKKKGYQDWYSSLTGETKRRVDEVENLKIKMGIE